MSDGQISRAYFRLQFISLFQATVLYDLLAKQLEAFVQPLQMLPDASFQGKNTPVRQN